MNWLPNFLSRKGRKRRYRKSAAPPQQQLANPEKTRRQLILLFLFSVFWTVSVLTISYKRTPAGKHYVLGQIVDRYVYSTVRFQYNDTALTEKRREQVAQTIPPVYRLIPSNIESSLQLFAEVSRSLNTPRNLPGNEEQPETGEYGETRVGDFLKDLSEEDQKILTEIVSRPHERDYLRGLIVDALYAGIANPEEIQILRQNEVLVDRIRVLTESNGNVRSYLISIRNLRDPENAGKWVTEEYLRRFRENTAKIKPALLRTIPRLLLPDLVYSTKATETERAKAIAKIKTAKQTVAANDVLLRPGQTVKENDLERLRRHAMEIHRIYSTQGHMFDVLINSLLLAILLGGALLCLDALVPSLMLDMHRCGALAVALAFQIILSRVAVNLHYMNFGASPLIFSALPLSLAAMLLAPLAGLRVAIWAGIIGAITAAMQNSPDVAFHIFIVGSGSSMVAATMARRIRKRAHIYRAGFAISAILLTLEVLFLLQLDFSSDSIVRLFSLLLLHTLINGFIVSLVMSALLPLVEYLFGLLSDITLVELSNPDHPLLKRLQLEAPGTYYHSISVATLSFQAAETIGANPLLARVCAYFHDVGKLTNPEYFTENGQTMNPHDDLRPSMSSLVIINHVKEGLELARAYKLKRPIREAIAQHHGTSLVSYFYGKARKENQENTKTSESDYRYPGPRPLRKEVAIISLADSCEAAVRSMEKPNRARIAALVERIAFDRIRDHQFDRADLTFAELDKISKCLSRTLAVMKHVRIAYPDTEPNEDTIDQRTKISEVQEP